MDSDKLSQSLNSEVGKRHHAIFAGAVDPDETVLRVHFGGDVPFNFVLFRPRKSGINVEIKLPRDATIDHKIEEAGLATLEYSTRWGVYRLVLSAEDVTTKRVVLAELFKLAHKHRAE